MKVGFLGAGLYGEALGHLAEINEHEVEYYDPYRFPERKIGEVISEAEVVVYVAPAEAYREILPELSYETSLILASKGFVSLKPFEKFRKFSALGGATFAEDIMEEKAGLKLAASSELSEQLFTTDFLTVEYTRDTKGVVLCGALKNVYAIGAGLMGAEDYLMKASSEMAEILTANGAEPTTIRLSCGVADLILSSTPEGRNFRFGEELKHFPESRVEPVGTVEGLTVVKSLEDFPDFVVPEGAKLFKEIVERVKNGIK
ncbi:hypothetical protein IJ090_01145 [Candidatus Saccharibacteria bacterium]|nr:hypothetical protein [Candidatus Saccharibacteria bacterium]